uniref:Uncharacterized protein n=1 Tax=Oryza punctata TaxID=4537 RepID=A0A0E0MMP6_ORYPU
MLTPPSQPCLQQDDHVRDANAIVLSTRAHSVDDGDGCLTEAADFGRMFVIGDSVVGTVMHHLTVRTRSATSNLAGVGSMPCDRTVDYVEQLSAMGKLVEFVGSECRKKTGRREKKIRAKLIFSVPLPHRASPPPPPLLRCQRVQVSRIGLGH